MKALIVSANREEINVRAWPLGAACVATAAQNAGHDVELIDLMGIEDPEQALKGVIVQFQPQLIGVSVRNVDDQRSDGHKILPGRNQGDNLYFPRFHESSHCAGRGRVTASYPAALLDYLGADIGNSRRRGEGFRDVDREAGKGKRTGWCPRPTFYRAKAFRGKGFLRKTWIFCLFRTSAFYLSPRSEILKIS